MSSSKVPIKYDHKSDSKLRQCAHGLSGRVGSSFVPLSWLGVCSASSCLPGLVFQSLGLGLVLAMEGQSLGIETPLLFVSLKTCFAERFILFGKTAQRQLPSYIQRKGK